MKKLPILFLLLISNTLYSQNLTPYEKGNGNQSTTYEEMREFYRGLSRQFPAISYETRGGR
ncbi:hypothetical protein KUH03_38775 [Sphingobacterium sp. E70]|uniref:hypothetical protein n=1 Tax=Sphingobacterium sp. E70 TaxID=2853439 RepID=UPI00211D033A|nr:hypothetical protein [Sphingobacterium sp. E70]ULT24778.1 hypothetical protein KUH03_38775 [Sphingobacterium sp. E70]